MAWQRQATEGLGEVVLKLIAPGNPGHDADIIANALHIMPLQRQGLRQRIQRPEVGHAHAACAEQFRGHIQQQFIDQAFADQGAVELKACFYMQLIRAAPSACKAWVFGAFVLEV